MLKPYNNSKNGQFIRAELNKSLLKDLVLPLMSFSEAKGIDPLASRKPPSGPSPSLDSGAKPQVGHSPGP